MIWKVIQGLLQLKRAKPSLESVYPPSDLDGLNVFYEQRLVEEGIEDIQNLATADFVELMLHTRIPLGRLVDWVDQGLLYLRLPPVLPGGNGGNGNGQPAEGDIPSERDTLRRFGIRTATDLVDVRYQLGTREINKVLHLDGEQASVTENGELQAGLERLLNDDGDEMSRTDAIFESLAREPNLVYVRNWKSWVEDPPD